MKKLWARVSFMEPGITPTIAGITVAKGYLLLFPLLNGEDGSAGGMMAEMF